MQCPSAAVALTSGKGQNRGRLAMNLAFQTSPLLTLEDVGVYCLTMVAANLLAGPEKGVLSRVGSGK